MLVKHILLLLTYNLAINFLCSINFDFLNYSFNFIRIVLINYYNINKDNYFNKVITIKTNQIYIRSKILLF